MVGQDRTGWTILYITLRYLSGSWVWERKKERKSSYIHSIKRFRYIALLHAYALPITPKSTHLRSTRNTADVEPPSPSTSTVALPADVNPLRLPRDAVR